MKSAYCQKTYLKGKLGSWREVIPLWGSLSNQEVFSNCYRKIPLSSQKAWKFQNPGMGIGLVMEITSSVFITEAYWVRTCGFSGSMFGSVRTYDLNFLLAKQSKIIFSLTWEIIFQLESVERSKTCITEQWKLKKVILNCNLKMYS